jgi:hypothetical protein
MLSYAHFLNIEISKGDEIFLLKFQMYIYFLIICYDAVIV